jgi:hypothetical protein
MQVLRASLPISRPIGTPSIVPMLLISAQVAKPGVLGNEASSQTSAQHEMQRFVGFTTMKATDQVKVML